LPPRFLLISGSIVAMTLRDVPLSTTLLTNGYGLLSVLWLMTPAHAIYDPIEEEWCRSIK